MKGVSGPLGPGAFRAASPGDRPHESPRCAGCGVRLAAPIPSVMERRRTIIRTGATLTFVAGALAIAPMALERIEGALSRSESPVDALGRALDVDSPQRADGGPTIFASRGRTLTDAQRRALLEQAIAAAPLPLADGADAMGPRDDSAAALRQRLQAALVRVVDNR